MNLLEIENVTLRFGGLVAVDNVSLKVEEGEVFALVGPNGAGKSTIFNLISRFYDPAEGSIRFDGQEITGLGAEAIVRKGIAHVPEGRGTFTRVTTEENLLLGAYTRPRNAAMRDDLERVYHYFPRLKERRHQQAGTLSGGEQQRVAIARAMAAGPKIIFADEPTGNLDGSTGTAIVDLLFERRAALGATLLIITHDPELARKCDRVISMQDGHVVESAA